MIDAGYLIETEPVSEGPGRPMVPLQVIPTRRFAIGIKMMATEVVAVLTDMASTIRVARCLPVEGSDRAAVVTAIAHAVATLPAKVRGSRSKLVGVGVGVGVGGHVDREHGVVRYSAALRWREIDLAGLVAAATDMPVVVENDANTLAVYEQWCGAGRDVGCFAVVTIGAGIGCGLVLDGDLYTGATGAAGEFGHLIVDPDGPRCHCGCRGCLESLVGDDAIVLPTVLGVAGGRHLDTSVQARLVDHVRGGGGLIWLGPLPERDLRDRPGRVLSEALGVSGGQLITGTGRYFPSVRGLGAATVLGETRVGWLQELTGGDPLLTDVDGRVRAAAASVGAGSAVLLAAELPSHPELFTSLVEMLGVRRGLALESAMPGVVATTTVSPSGDRVLHLLNPTG